MNPLIHNTAKSTSELEHFVLMLEEQASDAIDSSKYVGSSAHAGIIYDLNGRKVATASEAKHLSKGIYILNGKKMVVK